MYLDFCKSKGYNTVEFAYHTINAHCRIIGARAGQLLARVYVKLPRYVMPQKGPGGPCPEGPPQKMGDSVSYLEFYE